jgi:hypothetical protein
MVDKSEEILSELIGIGITEHDALIIADCVITRKSCSWMNTDTVDDKMLADLNNLIKKHNYGIHVKVDSIPSRNKYIWDVKVNK